MQVFFSLSYFNLFRSIEVIAVFFSFTLYQAMCKVSEGENAFAKIGEALDNLNSRGTGFGSSILGIRRIPPDSGQSNASYQDNGAPAPATNSSSRLPNGCDSDGQFPTELISSCVAMMLMIKVNHPSSVCCSDLAFRHFFA